MDESVSDEFRRQSILKSRPRLPLQEVQTFFGDDDTVTTTLTRNRRVSFGRKVIKEFLIGSAVSTQAVHEYEQSSESVSDPSDCSGPLDLALNKSCRDFETELEPNEPVITPPESFSDSKNRAPDQRARLFTENCINIAKSVFQDTETEMTAIIIGAKPTASDDDRKNSSCMSYTTLEVSQDFGSIRHPELIAHHPDPNYQLDKGRFDFLDQSLGNVTLGATAKPTRQIPRTPLAPISHFPQWDRENDENIPPAHNSFRHSHKANTSELTMDFTFGNIRGNRMHSTFNNYHESQSQYGDDMEETCKNPLNSKSVDISRANSMWQNLTGEDADEDEDPLKLDATRHDDFLADLSGCDGKTSASDDSDSSPFKNIHKQLANLSNVNQSFRERVQTLPGFLNASVAQLNTSETPDSGSPFANNETNNAELSFLQTPKGKICNQTKVLDDSMEMTVAGKISNEIEITESNIKAWQASDEADPLASDCLTPAKGNISIFGGSDDDDDDDEIDEVPKMGLDMLEGDQTMEFTQCKQLSNSVAKITVDNEPTMDFTNCNLAAVIIPEDESETPIVSQESSKCTQWSTDMEMTSAQQLVQKSPAKFEKTMEMENEPTMDFTNCNLAAVIIPEDESETPTVSQELSKCTQGSTDMEMTNAQQLVQKSPAKFEKTMEMENEPTMDFTNCNLAAVIIPEDESETPTVSQELSKCTQGSTDMEMTNAQQLVQKSPAKFEKTMEMENEPTMDFTNCNFEKSKISEITMEIEPLTDHQIENEKLENEHRVGITMDLTQCIVEKDDMIQTQIPSQESGKCTQGSAVMEMTNLPSQPVDNLETDETLPVEADDSSASLNNVSKHEEIPASQPDPFKSCDEDGTHISSTPLDPPLETPIAGLAALSALPSLKSQLQCAQPDSTVTISALGSQSEVIEEALRSMEITEGSIGGVLPKPMKTMSEEQHMKAIHESTRVIDDATKIVSEDTLPKENTYTVKHFEEATYTIPGMLNVEKRTHSDSPCPGERLKKNRISKSPLVTDFGKRTHSESPLPDQSLLKKNRSSNTPRVARVLSLAVNERDESLFVPDRFSNGLDVSVTLNDVTLSQTESFVMRNNSCSFGVLPMSLPERSFIPEENKMADISIPTLASLTEHEEITTNLPAIAVSTLDVDEDEHEVSSTTNIIENESMETDSDSPTESIQIEISQEANESIIRKIQTDLEQQSREKGCVWKLIQFQDGLIQIDLPLQATGLILDICYSDVKVTKLVTKLRPAGCYQRPIKAQINEFGFKTLQQYILKEEKRIKNLKDVSNSLDFFNAFTVKLTNVMKDALTVLHGCAGSHLSDDCLCIRLHMFPMLISCWVDLNLNDLLFLGQPGVRFRRETGRLDEQAVRSLISNVEQPLLQNFVRAAVSYVTQEETKMGFITKRPPLLF